jgi:eukaryotic-like serine/threonine-protein kinase
VASSNDILGKVFENRYRIDSLIARGGMATVYAGWDNRLARKVAIKVMHPSLAEDPTFLTRFEREARSAAALSHPHVVGVHDAGKDSATDSVFLVMEFVEGQSLREILNSRVQLTAAQALGVLDPVLQALDAAHRAGFIHRDIKPENIIIADDGRIKVADFGLARAMIDSGSQAATRGVLIGTVAYIAPEQVTRGTADERSDLYSTGVTLFELLTGKVPFEAETPIAVAFAHVHNDIPNLSEIQPELPAIISSFVQKLANRNPNERFASAAAALNELRSVRKSLDGYTPTKEAADFKATAVVNIPKSAVQGNNSPTQTIQPTQATAVHELPKSKKPKSKLRRAVGWAVAISLLAGSAFGYFTYTSSRTTVPQLVGANLESARVDLNALELKLEIASEVFDEKTQAGTILSANPESGVEVSKGSTISVVVSKGPEVYSVPNLSGVALGAAKDSLTSIGFKIGTVSTIFSETIAKDAVIESTPATGTLAKPGTSISLVVSKGPAPIKVPNVVNQPSAQAVAQLNAAGFESTRIVREFSDSVAKGLVIRTNPQPGQLKQTSVEIAIFVSDGPPPVSVPQLVGTTKTSALAALQNVGLTGKVIASNSCPAGKQARSRIVEEQLTTAGTMVPRGSTVELKIFVFCS